MTPEQTRTLTRWTPCIILGVIGLFFLIMTYGAAYISRKSGKFVSGVPCVGGFFIALGFLLSPCKWFAFLGLLDYGFWEIGYCLLIEPLLRKKRQSPPPDDHDPPEN